VRSRRHHRARRIRLEPSGPAVRFERIGLGARRGGHTGEKESQCER
jgi:hypothetical protein